MTTISTPFELDIREWSQIQGEKNIFPDLIHFLKIDWLEVEIYCTWAKKVSYVRISQQPFLALHSFDRHFYT